MGDAVTAGVGASSIEPQTKTRHRRDIQGLRAILMIQVLLFHAWSVGSPIGVDAFIMISAYLMTSSSVRRAEAGNMPSILERWATTFKRLLPPLAIVVVATLIASIFFLPPNRWQSMVTQSVASLTYWQNWLLSHISTDYFAQNHALSSPLQHLWSMSMQGQVFLAWPVVMALMVLLARRRRWSIRRTVFFGFAALTALSLTWLITTSAPTGAIYFDTRARIWEFALGSAIAALAPKLRLPERMARALTWLALAVLVLYCLVLIGEYPGPMAAVPMLATSVLLLFGGGPQPSGVTRLLSWRPLVELGNISYSVYLVHWPIFVLYLVAVGGEQLGFMEGLVLMQVSAWLAYLLTRFVDDPIRTLAWANTPARKAQIIAFTLWLALTFVFTVQVGINASAQSALRQAQQTSAAAAMGDEGAGATATSTPPSTEEEAEKTTGTLEGFPGAAAMLHGGDFAFVGDAIPSPFTLEDEWVWYEGVCSDAAANAVFREPQTGCHAYGDPATASGRVLVAGSSHAEQTLMPAVRLFAQQNNLYVEAVLKTGCPWSMPNPAEPESCGAHNLNVLRYAQEQPFDYVFLIVTATTADGPAESLGYDVQTLIKDLADTGATVIGIRDNLRSNTDLFECAATQDPATAFGGCLLNRADFFAEDTLVEPLLEMEGFHYVEVMDLLCTEDICPTIIGNVQVYLDTNHLTQSYANTMAPIIVSRIEDSLAN